MSRDTEAGFTTEIPMTFRRRGGKAVIVLPDGSRAIERREALIDSKRSINPALPLSA